MLRIGSFGRNLALTIVVAAGGMTLGACTTIQNMMPGNEAAEARAIELQELQLKVMRFADEYSGRVQEPVLRFQRDAHTPEERLAGQNWRLQQATSAYTIASGPNPVTNALDMVVLATLSRMVLQDSWVKNLYGERAASVREVHERLEPQAWALVDGILTADQIQQLHTIIDTWRADHPQVYAVTYIHFRDFARSIGKPAGGEEHTSGNLFSLLGLDPLSTLDPAVREISQTRQLAERTIYYVQRVPNLLDMQVERLTYQLAVMPETKDLLQNTDRISLAAQSAGKLADTLPQVLSSERQAAIDQFMAALSGQQTQMRELAGELKGTLEAGQATSDSLNATIRSLDTFMSRFDKPATATAPAATAHPFDINDYATAARELAGTARDLQSLIAQLDSSSNGVEKLTVHAAENLRVVVDHAFWRGVQLILVLITAILVAALLYRLALRRLMQAHENGRAA